MNTQTPSKRFKSEGLLLAVHSMFHTIQGEGPFSGVPCTFIRLAGCNLQCPGCDTVYDKGATHQSLENILDNVIALTNPTTKLIVITGGEPFRQNITPLIYTLQNQGYTVQIETNGTMAPQEELPGETVVICSPKTAKLNPKMFPYITAYKYVVNHTNVSDTDGLPLTALENKATPFVARPHVGFEGDIYVSPMDMTEHYLYEPTGRDENVYLQDVRFHHNVNTHNERNIKAITSSSLKFGYTIQLQLHKLINVE